MAKTTLSVRLVQRIQATTRHSAAFRLVMVTILLFTASISNSCGSSGDDAVSAGAASGGEVGPASASLAWDPVSGVLGYIVHYGTQSPHSPGSCAYAQSEFSSTPAAKVMGLAANTTYYFAVSAFNGLESACSGELSTVTDPV